MLNFRQMTLWERVKLWWPPYRREYEARLYAGIKYLVDHPDAPCSIDGRKIP